MKDWMPYELTDPLGNTKPPARRPTRKPHLSFEPNRANAALTFDEQPILEVGTAPTISASTMHEADLFLRWWEDVRWSYAAYIYTRGKRNKCSREEFIKLTLGGIVS